jgi:hypothetical protein
MNQAKLNPDQNPDLNPGSNPELERPPVALRVALWVMMALNIALNIFAGLLLVAFVMRGLTPNASRVIAPNYGSVIVPAISVLVTIISAIGTGMLRRWPAIIFLVLTMIGMLSVFGGGFNAPALALYVLSIAAVIVSWRWLR